MPHTNLSRRAFIPTTAAAFTIVPRHVLGGQGRTAPSDKLNIAGVGVGAMGGVYLRSCESENIVALADVDFAYASKTFTRYPNAAHYRDFRVMLDNEKGLDAVIIGTPDHTHAIVASAAMQRGKHVYCAKPMTRTVAECRHLAKTARDAKVATQMSTQSIASDAACTVEEIIQSGAIGPVREAHVWTDRPIWPQGIERPAAVPVPSTIDWDLWLGPAPARSYAHGYHPFTWRGWYDFGTGALGDMALHTFHNVFRALKLGAPTQVSSSTDLVRMSAPPLEGGPGVPKLRTAIHPETFPHAEIVTWDFAARGELPRVRLHWYDGGLKPPRPADLDPSRVLAKNGSYYVGDKGILVSDGSRYVLLPQDRFRDFKPPPKTIPRTAGHYQEWIAAAKGGPKANCNFDFASLITETALIGIVSARLDKQLVWDSPSMRFTNDAEANQFLNPPYRSGWSL